MSKRLTVFQEIQINYLEAILPQLRKPDTTVMFRYDGKSIDNGGTWSLIALKERVIAAEQLGYEVTLSFRNGDLFVEYRKPLPPIPGCL